MRSSWLPERTGARTKSPRARLRRPQGRTLLRNPQNDTPDRQVGKSGAHVPERTCVLTRRKGTRDSLIRLALGPDGQVGPDVRARAPGRGAWISVDRAELDAANAKGKLKGELA